MAEFEFNLSKRLLLPFSVKGNWVGRFGYIDLAGFEAIPPQYSAANHFSEGLANVSVSEDKYGSSRNNAKHGYINESGDAVLELRYLDSKPFSEGLAAVFIEDRIRGRGWSFINHDGEIVIRSRDNYEYFWFKNGNAIIADTCSYGFIDTQGNMITDVKYEAVGPFIDKIAPVCFEGKYGFIDMEGNLVIDFQYEEAFSHDDGLAVVRYHGKCGYIDLNGNWVIPPEYEYAGWFQEGLAPVCIKKRGRYKYGFINKHNEYSIRPTFDEVSHFSEGLAAAKRKNRWGYIDKNGAFVIKPIFRVADQFGNGVARVTVDAVSADGELFTPFSAYILKSGGFLWYPENASRVVDKIHF